MILQSGRDSWRRVNPRIYWCFFSVGGRRVMLMRRRRWRRWGLVVVWVSFDRVGDVWRMRYMWRWRMVGLLVVLNGVSRMISRMMMDIDGAMWRDWSGGRVLRGWSILRRGRGRKIGNVAEQSSIAKMRVGWQLIGVNWVCGRVVRIVGIRILIIYGRHIRNISHGWGTFVHSIFTFDIGDI
jgi:hypothetical protein